eukprot:Hpha_TRINITY_DN16214_c1_g2::TRINITY_DN16214_c1_g2_i1::g.16083::m.16083
MSAVQPLSFSTARQNDYVVEDFEMADFESASPLMLNLDADGNPPKRPPRDLLDGQSLNTPSIQLQGPSFLFTKRPLNTPALSSPGTELMLSPGWTTKEARYQGYWHSNRHAPKGGSYGSDIHVEDWTVTVTPCPKPAKIQVGSIMKLSSQAGKKTPAGSKRELTSSDKLEILKITSTRYLCMVDGDQQLTILLFHWEVDDTAPPTEQASYVEMICQTSVGTRLGPAGPLLQENRCHKNRIMWGSGETWTRAPPPSEPDNKEEESEKEEIKNEPKPGASSSTCCLVM